VFSRVRRQGGANEPAGQPDQVAPAGAVDLPGTPVDELGTVRTGSGEVILIDFGLLRFWSGEREPFMDEDFVGEQVARRANSAIDLQLVGEDPVGAGRAHDTRPSLVTPVRPAPPGTHRCTNTATV